MTDHAMKFAVNVFDENLKIVFYIFVEAFMKLFYIMDLLKIFRMQEPVPKDLLPKNPEIGKYREVVQEKDALLRNSKARIRELEQQIADLEMKNRCLEVQVNPKSDKNLIKEYEAFYSKIMLDSEGVIDQKQQMGAKLKEMETFCEDLLEKYEKSKNVINQYQESHEKLKGQVQEYEDMITTMTEEYNRLKEYVQNKLGVTESKSSFQQKASFKELLIKNKIQNACSKSMFEPLKGLDK